MAQRRFRSERWQEQRSQLLPRSMASALCAKRDSTQGQLGVGGLRDHVIHMHVHVYVHM